MKKFSIFSIIMLGVVMSALASFQVNAIAFNIKNTTSYRLYFAFYSNDRDYPLLNDTKTPGSANINRGLAPGEVKVVQLIGGNVIPTSYRISKDGGWHWDPAIDAPIYGNVAYEVQSFDNGQLKIVAQQASVAASVPVSASAGVGLTSYIPNNIYSYAWDGRWRLPEAGKGAVVFRARAIDNIIIGISDELRTKDPMYEIIIGGWENTKTVIRRGMGAAHSPRMTEVQFSIPNREYNSWWVAVNKDTGKISVGRGDVPGQNIITEWIDNRFLVNVQYISFTRWQKPVEYQDIRMQH